MIHKIIPPDSWDFGDVASRMVKISSRGLGSGGDFRSLVKLAGDKFAFEVSNLKDYDPDLYLPMHTRAMGATESYLANRNGDGFKRANLKRTHPTFVKFARYYRHHKNKDPKKSYGQVKLSSFIDAMDCVDLLVFLNRNEKAAKLNDNLVADEECHKLEVLGKSLPVSMSCKVAYDVCSVCGNKAPTRKQYCKSAEEGGTCSGFGCATGLTKVSASGHLQHVDNPDPCFGDISGVIRGADRIAFGDIADYLQKAAAEGYVPGGAELAEAVGLVTPLEMVLENVYDSRIAKQIKVAYELAAVEDSMEDNFTQPTVPLDRGLQMSQFRANDLSYMGRYGTRKFATALQALAAHKAVLPVQDFLRVVLGEDSEKYAAYSATVPGLLPGVFNRLIAMPDIENEFRHNPFQPAQEPAPAYQLEHASKQADLYSLSPDKVRLRASAAAIRQCSTPRLLSGENVKQASANAEAHALATAYGMYKVAFMAAQTDSLALTAELLVRQNYLA